MIVFKQEASSELVNVLEKYIIISNLKPHFLEDLRLHTYKK